MGRSRPRGGGPRHTPVGTTLGLLVRVSPAGSAALAVGVVAVGAVPAAFALASGALVQAIADGAGAGSPPVGGRVLGWTVAVVSLFAAQQIGAPGLRALAEAVGRRLDGHLRARVMEATLGPAGVGHLEDPAVLDQVSAAQAVGTGEITAKDAAVGMVGAASRTLAGLGAGAVLAAYRWWLAAALVGVYLAMTRTLTSDLRRTIASLRGHARRFRRSAYLRDLALTPAAAKEVRVFGLSGWVGERFADQWAAAMAGFWSERGRGRWLPPAVALALMVAQGGAYGLLARSAARGEISLGQLATFAAATTGVAAIFRIGIDDLNIGYGTAPVPAVAALERATRVARLRPPGGLPADGMPRSGIRFEGVGFTYPGRERPVYSGLDLDVPAGRSLALVGHNGAGKTTLVKLLAGLHQPTAGRILVDGADLADLDPVSWQRRLSATFQDFTRYRLSLADNVAFGAVERSGDLAALERAAARAGLGPLVERLPSGWDTVLSSDSPGGVDLSGGQWQRVALARALFALQAGAGVLVLDEPTAALDVRSEAAFYERFLELTAGVTTIVVSHRFSTVRRADRIVVLDQGRVAEDGSHDDLMAADGLYARLFRLQAAHFLDRPAATGAGAGGVGGVA